MEKTETQHYCAHCKMSFTCKANDISNCHCSNIVLSAHKLSKLKQTVSGCLCENCLAYFKQHQSLPSLILLMLMMLFFTFNVKAQFHGPVGSLNCNAIHKDSSVIVNWAKQCLVNRGFQSLDDESLGPTTTGHDTCAIGKAGESGVVSLGDKGEAILQFHKPIIDGLGHDFAVFENSFSDSFLELAFVEVSSDGIHYVRFPATSLTQTLTQIEAYDEVGEASKLNNLAGKYKAMYGTPFDLNELRDSVNVNIQYITHVKIIDVVGSINPLFASFDQYKQIINDPFPTAFPNGGFDLDAVGVIHQADIYTNINEQVNNFDVFPNPFNNVLTIHHQSGETINIELLNQFGVLIKKELISASDALIQTEELPSGIYVLKISEKGNTYFKKLIKN
jgi:hypothetical protein